MGLLDGGGAALLNSVFAGVYRDATLHRVAITPNNKGGGTTDRDDDGEPVKAMRARTTEKMMQRDGYRDTDMRILVLSQDGDGNEIDEITTEHEITFLGPRWSIAHVGRDPAGAYYDLHGKKAGTQP